MERKLKAASKIKLELVDKTEALRKTREALISSVEAFKRRQIKYPESMRVAHSRLDENIKKYTGLDPDYILRKLKSNSRVLEIYEDDETASIVSDATDSTVQQSDEIYEDDETASIVSDATDSTVQQSDEKNDVCEDEAYEAKVKEAMDLATEKSARTRRNALISLKIALQKRILTTFLCENHQTMSDLIERSLKKGSSMEQVAAAKLASILVISLMRTPEAKQVYAVLNPVLVTLVRDPTVSPQARQEFAYSLSIIAFMACPKRYDLLSTLDTLHNIFCNALPKGNGELPNNSRSLKAAALQGVCLLLTLLSHTTVYSMAPKMLEEFIPILMTTDQDLKIMVGEAIALIYERARQHSEEFRWKKQGLLFEKFNGLVSESHKYKAKKDRKVQRATVQEIMWTIKDGETISETVSVGPTHHHQELTLDSWALRFQYNMICHALDQSLYSHMTNNPALRDLFDLGPPPDPNTLKNHLTRNPKQPNRLTPELQERMVLRSNKNRHNRVAANGFDY